MPSCLPISLQGLLPKAVATVVKSLVIERKVREEGKLKCETKCVKIYR